MQRAFLIFALRNRWRAAAIAALGMVPPLSLWIVSAALVGVACLRYGFGEALFVAALGSAPLGLWSWFGAGGLGLSALIPLAVLLWILAPAWLLRRSGSWSLALMANIVLAAAFAAALSQFGGELLEKFSAQLSQLNEQIKMRLAESNVEAAEWLQLPLSSPLSLSLHIAGSISWVTALILVLSRYWQMLLDNPGRFGDEFRRFRLSPALALALLGGVLLSAQFAQPAWALILSMPLLLASVALVHGLNVDGQTLWLALFYAALFLMPQLLGLLLALAAVDSFVDFRRRLRGEDN